MLDVERYYRVLDIELGASPEEVHQGYLDMTWVWHPDRFVGHPRLQQKAHHKLQELNEAHERLRSCQSISYTKDLRSKSKFRTSPTPQNQSSSVGLYKPQVHRTWREQEKPTVRETRQNVSFKTNKLDDWLD